MSANQVTIVPVSGRKETKDFVLFPFRLYRDDPSGCRPHRRPDGPFRTPEEPLLRARRSAPLSRPPRWRDGTIAAIADEKHVEVWNESVGFFGEFECIDDPAVAHALLDAAREWLAARGREVMRGPLNMNINEEVGLLVDGFDGPPAVMMTYNPPYYQRLLEGYGLTKAKDLHAYKVDIAAIAPDLSNVPDRVKRMAKVAVERYKVEMRQVNLRDIAGELEHIKKIYRTAWEKNWGAIPMTDAEMEHLADSLVKIADPRLLYLAFIDGQPVGVFLALPDLNQVAIHMGGRPCPRLAAIPVVPPQDQRPEGDDHGGARRAPAQGDRRALLPRGHPAIQGDGHRVGEMS